MRTVVLIGGGALVASPLVAPPLKAQTDSTTGAPSPAVVHEPVALRVLRRLPPPFTAAAVGNVLGAPEKWGRTWDGYGKRLGDQFGFLLVQEGVLHGMRALLPWEPLPTDCGRAGSGTSFPRLVVARVGCSLRTTTTLQTVDGDIRPNVPFAVALVTATAASLTWRPERATAVKARSFVAQRLTISFSGTVVKRALFPPKPPPQPARPD